MKDLSIKSQVIAKKSKKEASRAGHSLCLFFFIHILIYFLKECLKLSIAITSISATVEKYLKEASPVSKNTADFVSPPPNQYLPAQMLGRMNGFCILFSSLLRN